MPPLEEMTFNEKEARKV
jgi:hypothetical protein